MLWMQRPDAGVSPRSPGTHQIRAGRAIRARLGADGGWAGRRWRLRGPRSGTSAGGPRGRDRSSGSAGSGEEGGRGMESSCAPRAPSPSRSLLRAAGAAAAAAERREAGEGRRQAAGMGEEAGGGSETGWGARADGLPRKEEGGALQSGKGSHRQRWGRRHSKGRERWGVSVTPCLLPWLSALSGLYPRPQLEVPRTSSKVLGRGRGTPAFWLEAPVRAHNTACSIAAAPGPHPRRSLPLFIYLPFLVRF